jgi:hypothetical protein
MEIPKSFEGVEVIEGGYFCQVISSDRTDYLLSNAPFANIGDDRPELLE